MNQQPFTFSLRLEDFDLGRLPISAEALRADADLMAQAVSQYYTEIFRGLRGTANVAIADGAVHVSWYPQTGEPRKLLLDHALSLLRRGNYRQADPILQSLLARFPDDPEVLYNYGMMLSDQCQVEPAVRLLQHLVEIAPEHSHGWTALGVALSRAGQGPEALRAFQRALEIDPANAYSARNAAAIIAETNPAEALSLFEKAVAVLKDDQQTLLGYGTCLLSLGRKNEADQALNRCIEINPLSDTAEQARVARTKMAHASMRSAVGGGLRPDVVMYCLDALKLFEEGGRTKAGAVTMEIALLAACRT